ncbi:PSD1 and planctomycete cytochrome C domain-containing protein [Thalassoglobus polymorphus]|uniref:Planctomycete cytochrome C n=1 Tax=Thalassoglobus polymorphus TaxID=2527994 RepID=A0A517QVC7_9PLAN|nr:PSD1 and planctomycete cytochrome C domain-containing protein [Thalassoglobus polymorphus]QDT35554.1 Planctomycete cytochrome C [Thalassoglobus polymorphus]
MNQLFSIAVAAILLTSVLHAEDEISFNRDIRPILSDKCFACHGPEEASREGGFRLDDQESSYGEADSGEHPIVPGKPNESELIARILSDDESIQMPPAETNKSLTAAEKELLKKWIASGAEWEAHWSFIPPELPELPEVSESEWVKNEIDRFILARLKKEGLVPTEQADKATLIRRATFDLIGLPPTPEEVKAFLADDSPDAYEKVIDRLLASERFGEHVGRFWLDAARYGDTHGLHLDNYREMWPYRDWVLKAFNKNMPFDQFIVEQVAGDLIPNPTDDQLIATGFNRAHVTTSEGGSIAAEVHMRNVVDRVVTFGTVFMGTTLECTSCHDHKFDPLTMTDFYSLYAYFNSIDGNPLDGNKKDPAPVLKVPTEEEKARLAKFDAEIAELQKQLNQPWPELVAAETAWANTVLEESGDGDVTWDVVVPDEFTSSGGADLKVLEDNSILATGPNPAKEIYEVVKQIEGTGWQGIRLEGLLDKANTNGGTGRSSNSNVVLTEFEVYAASLPDEGEEPQWKRVDIVKASADHAQTNGDFKIENAIDGKPKTGWATEGYAKKEPRTALFQTKAPFGLEGKSLVKIVQKYESVYANHQFGRYRLSLTKQQPIRSEVPAEILTILKVESEKRDQKQKDALRKYYRDNVTTDAGYIAVRDGLAAKNKAKTDLNNAITTTLIWKEKAKPVPAHILTRGEYDQPGEEVSRRTPEFLPPMAEGLPNDRMGLAQWLISREHPLTARVTINRFWQQFFGTGLVKTSEDFGSQGEQPSHPQLLDWLAVQFMNDNWDVKKSMKRIVMSATYQQSSKVSPELVKKDPENRLLARGPRFRLDAEMLRDQALFVSGLMVQKFGGESVKPPQPDGLWFAVGYSGSNTVKFKADTGPEKVHRRTVYTFIKRTAPPPQMNVFDGPSRESCTVRRERTNTPLQALLLFNDPQYVESAIALAARSMDEGGADEVAIANSMLWHALSREPSPTEIESLVKGYQQDVKLFDSNPAEAEKLIAISSTKVAEGKEVSKVAAWTMAANLLLNLDEVVTKN